MGGNGGDMMTRFGLRLLRTLGTGSILALLNLAAVAEPSDPGLQETARNHVSCYPFGIDAIGRGSMEEGITTWKGCFAPDYKFSVFLGRGEPTICPGDKCPFPKTMSSIEMRASLAKRVFDGAGFIRTSHHVTNATITMIDPEHARVKAYIQAWHVRREGGTVVGFGTWDLELAGKNGAWLITDEDLKIVGSGVLAAPQ
jgi:3-phenylpropionate/cinnamic acid dioxygenase small subunit